MPKYKQDEAHEKTDKIIDRMERKIAKEYKAAADEITEKINKLAEAFDKKNEEMRQKLIDGEITQKQYTDWRLNQIAASDRWVAMRDTLAEEITRANDIAKSVINDHMEEVYSMNRNYATYQVEKDSMIDTSYTLYNRRATEELFKNKKSLLPAPKPGTKAWEAAHNKDLKWNQQKINSSMIQGLLQGDSIPNIAKRLINVVGMNKSAAVRNARTMTTSIENKGRDDAYEELRDKGIELDTIWVSTLDDRTRHSHRTLYGEVRDESTGKYSNGLRYPGDPLGDPEEVYNCRCCETSTVKGFPIELPKWSPKMGDMTFEEWLGVHEDVASDATNQKDFGAIFKSIKGITEEFAEGMGSTISNCKIEEAKSVYEKFANQLECVDPNRKGGAFFHPTLDNKCGVRMNLGVVTKGDSCHKPFQTAFHEFGHMIDYLTNGSDNYVYLSNTELDGKRLRDVIKSDYKALKKALGVSKADDVVWELRDKRDSEKLDIYTVGDASDILEALTKQGYPLGVGHGVKYWRDRPETGIEREFFAEVLDSATANEASYEYMQRLFPNAIEWVWEAIRRKI